jgi:hypothetical protein
VFETFGQIVSKLSPYPQIAYSEHVVHEGCHKPRNNGSALCRKGPSDIEDVTTTIRRFVIVINFDHRKKNQFLTVSKGHHDGKLRVRKAKLIG